MARGHGDEGRRRVGRRRSLRLDEESLEDGDEKRRHKQKVRRAASCRRRTLQAVARDFSNADD